MFGRWRVAGGGTWGERRETEFHGIQRISHRLVSNGLNTQRARNGREIYTFRNTGRFWPNHEESELRVKHLFHIDVLSRSITVRHIIMGSPTCL